MVPASMVAHQVPLSMEFSRQASCSGLRFPSLGDLLDPGIEPVSLASPALASGFLPPAPPGKPKWKQMFTKKNVYTNVHSSIIHNNRKVGTTEIPKS